jgi:NIPSNAP
MTTSQLRMYVIAEGQMDGFVREWRERVVPLREAHGFRVVGAWTIPETNGFVWVISHDGDFAAADTAYSTSDERKALDPDPARNIESVDTRLMRPVEDG